MKRIDKEINMVKIIGIDKALKNMVNQLWFIKHFWPWSLYGPTLKNVFPDSKYEGEVGELYKIKTVKGRK